MKITFVVFSLDAGGAERVLSTMANYWVQKGWDIVILTLRNNPIPFYELEDRIHHIPLGISRESKSLFEGLYNNLCRVRKLRQVIRQSNPCAVISFIDRANILTLLATTGLKIPVIVSERTDPSAHSIDKISSWLRSKFYLSASAIVVQSETIRGFFSTKIQKITRVIPNPVPLPITLKKDSKSNTHKPLLVGMGRLGPEKGFDLLIRAFSQLPDSLNEWSLVIIGEGAEKGRLKSLVSQLELNGRVHFTGLIKQPETLLQHADLFVLSSRFEGFPNALCEAMACELPVISFDCPSGPREIIRDGVDGILVSPEDVQALTGAMERLMGDETERQRLASRAVEVTQRFSLEKVMIMWENVIQEVLAKNRIVE